MRILLGEEGMCMLAALPGDPLPKKKKKKARENPPLPLCHFSLSVSFTRDVSPLI